MRILGARIFWRENYKFLTGVAKEKVFIKIDRVI